MSYIGSIYNSLEGNNNTCIRQEILDITSPGKTAILGSVISMGIPFKPLAMPPMVQD